MVKQATVFILSIGLATAAAIAGCRGQAPDGEAAALGQAETGNPSSTAAQNPSQTSSNTPSPSTSPSQSRALPLDDPFAANIATHIATTPDPKITYSGEQTQAQSLDNQTFRDRVVAFVRLASTGGDTLSCNLRLASDRPFKALIWIFRDGTIAGRGQAVESGLCTALKEATRRAMASVQNDQKIIQQSRIVVELPDHKYSMVEFEGRGVELSHGLVPVRRFDKKLLKKRIEEGKAYLRRVVDAKHKGVHKYYRAPKDAFENKLHTIYTASTVFTMLKLYAYDGDKALLVDIERATEFLLSMQNRNPRERGYGGFFYSYNLDRQRPLRKQVVGTTSKTIFTLLELHELTKDDKYMEAARLAADWLISMQRPDGTVRSYLRQKSSGRWVFGKKESMLYTGQVLSALSRMYRATKHPKYREAASQTAAYMTHTISKKGCYLGDDYRKHNPISSSWAILSLFDFVRATGDLHTRDIVFDCADDLLGRQIRNAKDVYRYGRWQRSLSSSGNGWLAEVMAELYIYCRENKLGGCKRLEESIVRVLRLLMQYTYTPESSFVVKNPKAARGGVFWNVAERYVRTDSVCHAMNAYVYMMPYLEDGPLVELPEPPLAKRLALDSPAAAGSQTGGDEASDTPNGESEESEESAEESAEEAAPESGEVSKSRTPSSAGA